MVRIICKLLLRIFGFKAVGGVIPEPKAIVLGIPHTSNWDFILSFVYYRAVGGKSNTMVKKEFFVWPLGYFVRWMGGIPVDRSKGASPVSYTHLRAHETDSYLV